MANISPYPVEMHITLFILPKKKFKVSILHVVPNGCRQKPVFCA